MYVPSFFQRCKFFQPVPVKFFVPVYRFLPPISSSLTIVEISCFHTLLLICPCTSVSCVPCVLTVSVTVCTWASAEAALLFAASARVYTPSAFVTAVCTSVVICLNATSNVWLSASTNTRALLIVSLLPLITVKRLVISSLFAEMLALSDTISFRIIGLFMPSSCTPYNGSNISFPFLSQM